jgi:hypothetical protein
MKQVQEILIILIAIHCFYLAASINRSGKSRIENFSVEFWVQATLIFIGCVLIGVKK